MKFSFQVGAYSSPLWWPKESIPHTDRAAKTESQSMNLWNEPPNCAEILETQQELNVFSVLSAYCSQQLMIGYHRKVVPIQLQCTNITPGKTIMKRKPSAAAAWTKTIGAGRELQHLHWISLWDSFHRLVKSQRRSLLQITLVALP